jgi:hypothetical protein
MKRLCLFLLPLLPGAALADALPYPVVDTGLVHCYDDRGGLVCPKAGRNFSGQDGQIRGHAPAYRDNGDGTVTDQVTGLIWQKAFKQVRWGDAAADARADRTGGFDDWRVPTIKELYSLILFSGATGSAGPGAFKAPPDARPYLDTRVFEFEYSPVGRYIDAQYLSATRVLSGTMRGEESFYGVNFADGRIKGYPTRGNMSRDTFYVRYVRGNPAYGRNDFLDNGDGTVADRATGLTWMQTDSGDAALRKYLSHARRKDGAMDWGEALRFCSSLEVAGQRDWRLPDAKELHSLVDYGRTPATHKTAAIDPLFRVTGITNEAGQPDFPAYWTSTTHQDGPQPGARAVYLAFGQALGYMRPRGESRFAYMDVHGAGAQRSDLKTGDEQAWSNGPQGDIQRTYHFVRCVRGGGEFFENKNEPPATAAPRGAWRMPPPGVRERGGGAISPPAPSQEAVMACSGQAVGSQCRFVASFGQRIQGVCDQLMELKACVPGR